MIRISNKLFQNLKLKNSEITKIVGGIGTTTSQSTDTNIANGAGHDVAYDSHDNSGQVNDVNVAVTTTHMDKPATIGLQTQSVQG